MQQEMGRQHPAEVGLTEEQCPSSMVSPIPLELCSVVVMLAEMQRTAAQEEPKSPECWVGAQKRCGLGVIKGSLRTASKIRPHRAYRTGKGQENRPRRSACVFEGNLFFDM